MALASSARTELYQVVVALYKRNHAQEKSVPLAVAQLTGLNADGAEQKALPFLGSERLAGLSQDIQHVALGQLNLPQ